MLFRFELPQAEARRLAHEVADEVVLQFTGEPGVADTKITYVALSPHALRVTRDLMYRMESMNFADVPAAALEATSGAFASEDSHEARRAFIETRKPVWRGR